MSDVQVNDERAVGSVGRIQRLANNQEPRANSGFLASRRESAHVRVGHAQILVGIHRDVIDAHFVVEVGSSRTSAVTHIADGVAAVNMLSGINRKALHVPVARRNAVAMIQDDRASIPAHEVGELNNSIRGCQNGLSIYRANVHA